jgi:PKD domain-containing protein
VIDINGNPLTSAPMSFSTTAGTLDQGFVTTDQNGTATTILRTSSAATVTAAVGAQAGSTTPPATGTPTTPAAPAASGQSSGSVTVNVSGAPSIVITPPATPPGAGLPASFTIAITAATANGSAIRNVRVNWGDGGSQDLGVVTGSAVVSHVYDIAQNYVVTVTATDSFGNSVTVSSFVTVIPVGSPTVNVTASVPTTPNPITTVTFTIQVTPPTGVGIRNATIDYGDHQSDTLGGVNGTITKTHTYTHTPNQPYTVSVTVEDTLHRLTTGTTTIVVP